MSAPAAPEPPRVAQAAEDWTIDLQVSRRFWTERAAGMDPSDPRSVTLDRDSAASVAREVALYQSWTTRQLEARGVSFDTVADVGCGNGDWTVALAGRARRLVAVDFTEEFLRVCGERVARSGAPVELELVRGEVGSLELAGPFDLIVAGAVLQYVSDDDVRAFLRRTAAALAERRGLLYLRATVAQRAERRSKCTGEYQAIYRSIRWYREALAGAGFQIEVASRATDFVADEIGRRALGAAGPLLGWPLRLVRRAYRSFKRTDVLACVARPR
ncbi:MAG TPA: class I SAM-dependent methyltransferase [Kofleriaceae bacterium]|nr:class I SAM-dependent methyltransferase [Kofleriaceae bacterium]